MKYLNGMIFFLFLTGGAFGQVQHLAPARVLQLMGSQEQLAAYERWNADNDVHDRFITHASKGTRGIKWRLREKYSNNKCYERLTYLSAYLYHRKIGKAKWCMSADSCLGIKLWMDLDRKKVKSLQDFVRLPNLFNDSLQVRDLPKYKEIALRIGRQVYKDVIKDQQVDYDEFVIIYFRAKKCEKSLFCIVLKEGEKYLVADAYFLPKPLY